jgi:hypothetical protein
MSMNKNEMHRVPGFTAEQALEEGASTPYAGLALRGEGGGAVEPATVYVGYDPRTGGVLVSYVPDGRNGVVLGDPPHHGYY